MCIYIIIQSYWRNFHTETAIALLNPLASCFSLLLLLLSSSFWKAAFSVSGIQILTRLLIHITLALAKPHLLVSCSEGCRYMFPCQLMKMYDDWTWLLLMGLHVPKSWKNKADMNMIESAYQLGTTCDRQAVSHQHITIASRHANPDHTSLPLPWYLPPWSLVRSEMLFQCIFPWDTWSCKWTTVTVTHRKAAPWPKPYLQHLRNQKPFRLFRLRSRKCVPSHPGRKH